MKLILEDVPENQKYEEINKKLTAFYSSGIYSQCKFFWEILLNKTTIHTAITKNAIYRSDTDIPLNFIFENVKEENCKSQKR